MPVGDDEKVGKKDESSDPADDPGSLTRQGPTMLAVDVICNSVCDVHRNTLVLGAKEKECTDPQAVLCFCV